MTIDAQTLKDDLDHFTKETKYLRALHVGDLPRIIDARKHRSAKEVTAVVLAIGEHKTWGSEAHFVEVKQLRTAWKLAIEKAEGRDT